MPETPPLYTDMYVWDYLEYVAKLKGVEKSHIKKQVEMAIERTHIQSVSHRLIQNLSKGFKQRVGIAQALVSEPEILILDEPTVGLDPKQVSEIRDLIKQLKGQHTVVLSTHILPEVQASCERIIIINKGHIVAEDSLLGLNKKMKGSHRIFVKVKNLADSLIKELAAVQGVIDINKGEADGTIILTTENDEAIQQQIATKVATSGAGLIEMRAQDYSLEDIFLKVTSSEGDLR